MDFRNILNILMDALEITKSVLKEAYKFRFGKLRLAVYRVVSLWCLTLKEGSHCEIIFEAIIKEIMKDIMPRTQHFSSASINGDKQHLGEIFLMLDASMGNENDTMLRQQAYFCLQQLLSSSGHMLKSYNLKDVHNNILDISIQMQSNQMTKPYSSSILNSRVNLDTLLMLLLKSRNYGCPVPVEIIISLMSTFRVCDKSIEFSQNAHFESLEQMIHSHKSGIYFKQNFIDIQCLNSSHENLRLSRSAEQTLSKICSQQNSNQLPHSQIEEEDTRNNLSQNSSKYDICDSYYDSNADLMIIHEQELNTKGLGNNSSNRSMALENSSQQIIVKDNEIISIPLTNEVKNHEPNVEDSSKIFEDNIFEKYDIALTSGGKLGNDDIMIAELEATFVSELK